MKPAFFTLVYYATAIVSVFFLNKLSPSGPCAIGMGALLALLLVPTSIVLFIASIVKSVRSGKHWLGAVFVHLALLLLSFFQ